MKKKIYKYDKIQLDIPITFVENGWGGYECHQERQLINFSFLIDLNKNNPVWICKDMK